MDEEETAKRSPYWGVGFLAIVWVLLLATCLGADESGRPTAAALRREAEPFAREFNGTARYADRVSSRSVSMEWPNGRVNHDNFDRIAQREGWTFLREETRLFSSSRMYSKGRLCLGLSENDSGAAIWLMWDSNTRSDYYCSTERRL